MKRDENQPAWEKIVDKGFSDYPKLNRDERVWFNIEPLIELGLWDHYMNTGADHNADTIDDLEYLNFSSIASLLRKFNSKYFPAGVPIGPDARAEKLDSFPEATLEKDIDEMEDIFRAHCEDLNIALTLHSKNWNWENIVISQTTMPLVHSLFSDFPIFQFSPSPNISFQTFFFLNLRYIRMET